MLVPVRVGSLGAMWGSGTSAARRVAATVAISGALVAVTGCPPTPTAPPTWVTTRAARTVTPTTITNFAGGWTSENWAATVQITGPTSPGPAGTATINFYPRSGPGHSVLGSPIQFPLTTGVSLRGAIGGQHVVAAAGSGLEFFVEQSGTWAPAGTFTLPAERAPIAMSDDWLFLRRVPVNPGVEALVDAYSLDRTTGTVVPTLRGTLSGDPTWPLETREGFGQVAAVDGGLLAISAQASFSPGPGALRIFRLTSGTWAPVQGLGAATGGPTQFARSVAVDDGATTDRVAFSSADGTTLAGTVTVIADGGSGFTTEQTLTPGPAADIYGGRLFGQGLALDGTLLAVTGRAVLKPSVDVGHPDVYQGYVQILRRGSTWAPEAEVPVFDEPASPGIVGALPFALQAAGNHVAVLVLVSPDPPPNCSFPCFTLGMEAWSIDRTG